MSRAVQVTSARRSQVRERDGHACLVCGEGGALEVHHRTPRGAGGSRDRHSACFCNLALLCTRHHAWFERNRLIALTDGFLVRRVDHPADVPVRTRAGRIYLRCDGSVTLPIGATA